MPGSEGKAMLLLHQGRHALAEAELRLLISERPNDGELRQMLARALDGQGKHAAALHEAREGVRLDPDSSLAYYTLAMVHLSRDETKDGWAAIERAIELDPHDPDCYAVRAVIRLRQNKPAEALEAAEQGLAIDAEHSGCVSFRTQALTRLGRRDEAQSTLSELLARDPENDITHCNLGWELLHAGRHEEAANHFREALRLDPEYEHAREGLIEALRSRHTFYGLMLRALFAISRWPTWVQWGAMIAYLVGMQWLRIATRGAGPYVKVSVTMLNVLLLLFWVFVNAGGQWLLLTLRFSRGGGRHVLSEAQRSASTWHAVLLVLIVVVLAGWRFVGLPSALILALVFGLLVPMVSHVYQCPPGRLRRLMTAYTVATAAVGLLAVPIVALFAALALLFLNALIPSLLLMRHHPKLFILFAVGALTSEFVARHLRLQQLRQAGAYEI